jgi:hypothetical protein
VVTAEAAPGRFGLLGAWWRLDRGSLLQFVALVLAVLSFAWLWPSLIDAGGARTVLSNLVVHGYALSVLMLVSVSVRTIGSREVLVAYLTGTFLVPTLVFVTGWPVLASLGSTSRAIAIYWAPPLEETALLVAIALLAWRLSRRPGRAPAMIDLLIVGYAVGSGVAVHEDALYGRLLAGHPNTTLTAAFEGPYAWLFPSFLPPGSTFGTYHAGSGAAFGIAIGAVILLRRRFPHIIWSLPVVWAYLVGDHWLMNYQAARGPTWVRHLFGDGHVLAVALVVAVPALIVVAHLRRRKATLDPPAFGLRSFVDIATYSDGPGDTLVRWLALARYHRTGNAAIVAAWRDPDRPPPDEAGIHAWGYLALGRGLFHPPLGAPPSGGRTDWPPPTPH